MLREALAITLIATAPAVADTIGREVKLTKAAIDAGRVQVSGVGRPYAWYRAIDATGVLGRAYRAKATGAFSINGGTTQPASCTIALDTSPTGLPGSWQRVHGGVLLSSCLASPPADIIKVSKTCDTEHDDAWVIVHTAYGEEHACHAACPVGTTPVAATQTVSMIGDQERNDRFEAIRADTYMDIDAASLGVQPGKQFVALYTGGLDPPWFTTVTVAIDCRSGGP